MDDLVGVTSWTPADGRARFAAALNAREWNGRPMGAEDSPIPAELDELANVAEAPAGPAGLTDYETGIMDGFNLGKLTEDEGIVD